MRDADTTHMHSAYAMARCLSARHKPVLYRNGWTDWTGFRNR